MPLGGRRPGAGRPKGSKNGSALRRRMLRSPPPPVDCAPISPGLTPLEYMLRVMRDETADIARRDRMAIAASIFCHPRMYENRIGKKTTKAAAAKTAGAGSAWERDLAFGDETQVN